MAARGLAFLLLAFISLPVCSSEPRRQPFFDPACSTIDCSWSWESPSPGDQFCERSLVDGHNICPNNFGQPDTVTDRPPPASAVQVVDFEADFTSLEPGANGQYTCLNITYTITQFAAEKVKGLQLSVRGRENPDLSLLSCLSRNFSSQGLNLYAVRDVVFANTCFCGLKPGRQYEVNVRTLPVDGMKEDPFDTNVQVLIRGDGCDVPSKQSNVRCQNSVEANWEPECIMISQPTQMADYDSLTVWFDLAPADYNFDQYRVYVYRYTNGPLSRPLDYREVNLKTDPVVQRTCPMSLEPKDVCLLTFNITQWEIDIKGETFIVRLKPDPSSDSKCLDAELDETPCKTSQSSQFSLITDPCIGNPCSTIEGRTVGTCTPQGAIYTCSCVEGYRVWEQTCIADPCKFIASNDSKESQCTDGECEYTASIDSWASHCPNGVCEYSPDQTDFYCICDEGYVLINSQCMANPCSRNPGTNLTVCGAYGECIMNLTNNQVPHTCSCDDGYEVDRDKGDCQAIGASIGLIIGVSLGSCALGLVLIFVLFCFCHTRKKSEGPHTLPHQTVLGPRQDHPKPFVSFPERRRVLPIYSEDHPLHQKVIQCFCRLLQMHCSCQVSLIDWQNAIAPSVEMWLSAEMDQADIVLLLCSKGTGIKYKDRAKLKTPSSSPGVYGDVYIKALALLDDYLQQNNAHEKFVVAYFDYSSEADIPVTFRRFAKYKLMQNMESLFLKIHGKGKDSPHSTRRAGNINEAQYASLDMGPPLCRAIEEMKAMVKSNAKWYENYNSENSTDAYSPHNAPLMNSLYPQVSVDSAYDSGGLPRAPPGFFNDSDSNRSSLAADFEESLRQFQSYPSKVSGPGTGPGLPSLDQPQTRLLSQDIHMNMEGDLGNPFQSQSFFSDIRLANVGTSHIRPGSSA